MAFPWLQVVQLVPSLLDVSRELMRKTRGIPEIALPTQVLSDEHLSARVAQLEENERRQAELVAKMAEQIDMLSRAVTVLHKRLLWLAGGCTAAIIVAIVAVARGAGA